MFNDLIIVELGMYLPLPYAGGFFAKMGAKVIKIEPPGGDPIKEFDEEAYRYLNKNKELFFLNLKDEGDRKKVLELLCSADVVLNGFRRGFLERLGLGYNAVRENNRKAIFLSLSGYEKETKDSNKAGHDLNFVGLSGIMKNFETTGKLFPFQLADMAGALWAIIGVFVMLEQRRKNGVGGELDLSLFRSVLSVFPFFYSSKEDGVIEKGIFTGDFACYNIYKTKDGEAIAFGCIEKKFFKRALEILNISFDDDMLFNKEAQPFLIKKIAETIAKREKKYWLSLFEKEDICVTPVNDKKGFFAYLKEQGIDGERLYSFLFSPV